MKHTGDLLVLYPMRNFYFFNTKSCLYRDTSQQPRYAKTKFEHSRLHGSLRESGYYNNSWL